MSVFASSPATAAALCMFRVSMHDFSIVLKAIKFGWKPRFCSVSNLCQRETLLSYPKCHLVAARQSAEGSRRVGSSSIPAKICFPT